MNALIAVDIGNTKAAFAHFVGSELRGTIILRTDDLDSAPIPFLDLKLQYYVASVVPKATQTFSARVPSLATVLTAEGIEMPHAYHDIRELGIDRLLAAKAAYEVYGKPLGEGVIVVSLGTATTIEVIDQSGKYLGGAITLGIQSTIDAVHERTAQLPIVAIELPPKVIGRSTEECLQSGIVQGAIYATQGLIDAMAREAFGGKGYQLIVTGGLAEFGRSHLRDVSQVDPDLVLYGIRSSIL